jgi:hypothetical protein
LERIAAPRVAEVVALIEIIFIAGGLTMHKLAVAAAAMLTLAVVPPAAHAAGERTLTGAAIGAGTGAVVAGPPGAVVGGVVGAVVGGPRISHSHRSRTCWYDAGGMRHCRWR